jgi:hypothetical protein
LSNTWRRVAEKAAESAVGLLVVGGVYYWATSRPNEDFPAKWVAFGFVTAVLFGYPIYWRWHDLRDRRFWFRWTGLLFIHSLLLGRLLTSVNRLPLVFFIPIALAEFVVIAPLLDRTIVTHGPPK